MVHYKYLIYKYDSEFANYLSNVIYNQNKIQSWKISESFIRPVSFASFNLRYFFSLSGLFVAHKFLMVYFSTSVDFPLVQNHMIFPHEWNQIRPLEKEYHTCNAVFFQCSIF